MTPRAHVSLATLCAAVLSVEWGAVAAPGAGVVLDVDGCERADELERMIRLELGAPRESGRDRAVVAVRCVEAAVTLRVGSRAERSERMKPLERTLDLVRTPLEVRPRMIALAAVEMIAAYDEALAAAAALDAEAAALRAAAAPATRPAEDDRSRMPRQSRARVGVLASVAMFPGNTGGLAGGGLRGVFGLPSVDVLVDVRAHRGTDRVSLGEVSITTLDGAVGVSRARRWRDLELAIAAGVRGGKVWFTGTPGMEARGEAFSAPWWGAFADASVERSVSSTVRASFGVEVGRVVLPAGALIGGVREVAIDGTWIGARGGVFATW